MRPALALLILATAAPAFAAPQPSGPSHHPAAKPAATSAPTTRNAPADRYFGKLKMSALRVRFDLMQLAAQMHRGERCAAEVEQRLTLTRDAFDDWRRQFPRDTWLPQTALRFAHVEAEIGSPAALQTAHELLELTAHGLGDNRWAQIAKDELHRGLPRPTPSPSGTPVPCTSPSPSPAPSAPAGAEPSAQPSIAPSAAPGETPAAAPSAETSVAPSSAPAPSAPPEAPSTAPSAAPRAGQASPSAAARSRSSVTAAAVAAAIRRGA